MYCNNCGEADHYAGNCPNPVSPKVQRPDKSAPGEDDVSSDRVAARPDPKPKEARPDGEDSYCESCGANLTAKTKERDRRRKYMRKYRRDRK